MSDPPPTAGSASERDMDDAAINTYLMNKTPPRLKPYNITDKEISASPYVAHRKRIHNIIATCRLNARDASFYPYLNTQLNNITAAIDKVFREYYDSQKSPYNANTPNTLYKLSPIIEALDLLYECAQAYRDRQYWPDCLFTELPRRN